MSLQAGHYPIKFTLSLLRKLIAFLLVICIVYPVAARHIKGGYIYYQCLGLSPSDASKLRYRVTVKLYRDCGQESANQNPTILDITIFNNSNNQYNSTFQAPKTREYYLQKGSFSNCINPVPTICYKILEYQGTVDLSPAAQGYTLSFQRCCRIDGIVNMNAPSNSVGITYTITIPGTAVNAQYPVNSSPIFVEKDTAVTCYRSNFTLDYSATDPDGDVLVYSFAPALSGGNQNNTNPTVASPPPYSSVSYSGAYSAVNPFSTFVSINPNTGIITGITPSATGEYVLAVSVKEYRNGNFIAETRKELHVVVAGCTIAEASLPPKIISCDSFTVQFQNQSSSPSIRSYYWDFGVPGITSDTSTAASPSYTYPDTGTYTARLIVNRSESCSDSAFTQVIVYPGFKPNFTVVGSCILNPFSFIDATQSRYGTVNQRKWDFGEPGTTNDTASGSPATYRYPTTGTKTVTLFVADSKGCEATITKPLDVLEKPPLQLAFRDTLICSIDTLQLRAGSTGNYVWTPDFRIINRFTATPSVFPQDTITYYVTVSDNGCVNTDSVRINVLDSITVNAGRDTTICRTDGIVLTPVSYGLQYQWTPAATLDNARKKYPVATPTAALTSYHVIAYLGKCTAEDDVVIKTVPYPGSNAGADTALCFNTGGILKGSIVGSSFAWTPRNLVGNPNSLTTPVRPPVSTNFVLTVYDTLGCPKPGRDTVLVRVLPKLNVFAGNDTAVTINQPLLFVATPAPPATTYHWSPAFALSNPDTLNPTAVYINTDLPNGDSIRYRLTATTAIGCTGYDDITVKIFKTGPSIFVPSGFTPNGDGNNDIIRPILVGMKQLDYFRIYNRLGQLVFSTTTSNDGWDGLINGNPQSSAGYVYSVQAVDYTGKVVRQSGTILLVR